MHNFDRNTEELLKQQIKYGNILEKRSFCIDKNKTILYWIRGFFFLLVLVIIAFGLFFNEIYNEIPSYFYIIYILCVGLTLLHFELTKFKLYVTSHYIFFRSIKREFLFFKTTYNIEYIAIEDVTFWNIVDDNLLIKLTNRGIDKIVSEYKEYYNDDKSMTYKEKRDLLEEIRYDLINDGILIYLPKEKNILIEIKDILNRYLPSKCILKEKEEEQYISNKNTKELLKQQKKEGNILFKEKIYRNVVSMIFQCLLGCILLLLASICLFIYADHSSFHFVFSIVLYILALSRFKSQEIELYITSHYIFFRECERKFLFFTKTKHIESICRQNVISCKNKSISGHYYKCIFFQLTNSGIEKYLSEYKEKLLEDAKKRGLNKLTKEYIEDYKEYKEDLTDDDRGYRLPLLFDDEADACRVVDIINKYIGK